jgi:hypothetical protein
LPVAFLFTRRRGPIALLGPPSRPRPCRLPALLAAIALPRPSRTKPLLTSFEETPPRPRGTTLPARQPFPSAALLIFGMACSTLGRAQGRSLLPEALPRRGLHSSPGRSRSSDQYEINNSIAKIGCPRPRLSGVLFSPPPAAQRGPPAAPFAGPATIASLETSSVRLVPSHRYSALAAWSPLARQNGSLPDRR